MQQILAREYPCCISEE
jgi:predicted dehydrogenase